MSDSFAAALRWIVPAALGASWLMALALPAVEVAGGPSLSGYTLLARGWRGVEAGVFAWYANPLFLGALLASALRSHRVALVLSATSLLLALTSFMAEDLAGARGVSVPPLSFGAGFYLWLTAPLMLAAWSGIVAAGGLPGAARRNRESRD